MGICFACGKICFSCTLTVQWTTPLRKHLMCFININNTDIKPNQYIQGMELSGWIKTGGGWGAAGEGRLFLTLLIDCGGLYLIIDLFLILNVQLGVRVDSDQDRFEHTGQKHASYTVVYVEHLHLIIDGGRKETQICTRDTVTSFLKWSSVYRTEAEEEHRLREIVSGGNEPLFFLECSETGHKCFSTEDNGHFLYMDCYIYLLPEHKWKDLRCPAGAAD